MSLVTELLGGRTTCACGAPLPEGERFDDGLCYACWLKECREVST